MRTTAPVSDSHLTHHAQDRMRTRGISAAAIDAAQRYGRAVYKRGAEIYAIGRREVDEHSRHGIDLSPYQGLRVICSGNDGSVITTYYRRGDFDDLRPKRTGPARRRKRRHR